MVDPGRLQLHDAVAPALADGHYRVGLAPTLAPGVPGQAPPAGTLDLVVAGPAPDPARVRSHPAAGLTGDFADDLPFVLLERRTLPWERSGFGRPGIPWLALVLTRDDATPEATLAAAAGSAGGAAATLSCLDLATQARVLPRPDEVRLLAHVREYAAVDAAAGGDDDGWLAVVVANRLPRATGRWRLTLVGLDDRADLLGASPRLGLAALWSSTFNVASAGGSFGARLAAIRPARFADPATPQSPVDATGAVVLAHQDRAGRTTPARYRSPLAASAQVIAASGDPQAPPDLTPTAAAELGRLLAAADGRLLADLAGWHQARLRARAAAAATPSLPAPEALAPGAPAMRRAVAGAVESGRAEATAASLREVAATVGEQTLSRWQRQDLPAAGRFGAAATPAPRDVLRRRRGGGWR